MNEHSTRTQKPDVLVADSDPGVRDLIGRYASEQGYNVRFAATGYEALDSARKEPPLAIFADLLLPRLDGLALCRLIKNDPVEEIKAVEVIVLSVLPAETRALQAGAKSFIKKPLEKGRVVSALEATARDRGIK
jgi:CheY-like chemotaxis protein